MTIVRAPRINQNGSIGIRGWRALCSCLWLGRVTSYTAASKDLTEHHKTCIHK